MKNINPLFRELYFDYNKGAKESCGIDSIIQYKHTQVYKHTNIYFCTTLWGLLSTQCILPTIILTLNLNLYLYTCFLHLDPKLTLILYSYKPIKLMVRMINVV